MIEGIHGNLVAIGVGFIIIGASYGIGKLAASAMDGIARQPEAGDKIQKSMVIAAALIEGIALFGLVICIIIINA